MASKNPNQRFFEQFPNPYIPNRPFDPPKMNGSNGSRKVSPPSPPPKKRLPTPRAGAAGEMRYVPTPSKTKTKPSTVPQWTRLDITGGPRNKRKKA